MTSSGRTGFSEMSDCTSLCDVRSWGLLELVKGRISFFEMSCQILQWYFTLGLFRFFEDLLHSFGWLVSDRGFRFGVLRQCLFAVCWARNLDCSCCCFPVGAGVGGRNRMVSCFGVVWA